MSSERERTIFPQNRRFEAAALTSHVLDSTNQVEIAISGHRSSPNFIVGFFYQPGDQLGRAEPERNRIIEKLGIRMSHEGLVGARRDSPAIFSATASSPRSYSIHLDYVRAIGAEAFSLTQMVHKGGRTVG